MSPEQSNPPLAGFEDAQMYGVPTYFLATAMAAIPASDVPGAGLTAEPFGTALT